MKKLLAASIVSVLLAGATQAAAPSLNRMLDSVKLSTASVGFLSDMELARGEAFARNTTVVMCKSADGHTCATTGAWDQGWIVFADANSNGRFERGEKVIVRSPRLASSLRFSGDLRAVSFSPAGAVKLSGALAGKGTLTVCRVSAAVAEARSITVAATGGSRVLRSTVSRCA